MIDSMNKRIQMNVIALSLQIGFLFLICGIAFGQVTPQKQYLPSQQELSFSKEVLHNCFGINKNEKATAGVSAPGYQLLPEVPFSFVLDGKSSRDFLNDWSFSIKDSLASDRNFYKLQWTNHDRTFEVRCNVVAYIKYPAIEWKMYFKNTGKQNSPVLEKVLPLDAVITRANQVRDTAGLSPVIHCNKGSDNAFTDFMPVPQVIEKGKDFHMKSHAGRSSETFLPFWNYECNGGGLLTAIGWSGDWNADFSYKEKKQATMKAGMANINLYLKPGEEISSPSVCLLYWEGKDARRGNNLFRRYMRDVVVPKWNGKEPFIYGMSGCAATLGGVNEKNQVDFIQKMAGCGANVYWLDGGWSESLKDKSWWSSRGDWNADPVKFPKGLRVLADEAHKNGLKFLLWYDPEIVCPGTEIAVKHPDWVLRASEKDDGLYNLGNPDALKYMTDLVSADMKKWDVDIYRNDYNIDPGPRWKLGDVPGRIGITEIRYVEGLYRFWDELVKRKPGLLIDNCASGGRRIDYETCKRSIPLWRSDYQCGIAPDVFNSGQNQTYGLGEYLPFNSIGYDYETYDDKYSYRSISSCSLSLYIPLDSLGGTNVELPYDNLKKLWNDVKSYNKLMVCDYYPLTEYSLNDNTWMALQYDCPEKGEGCLLCFRRETSPASEVEFELKAIDPEATYRLVYQDSGREEMVKGCQLKKLSVRLNRRESIVLKYRKIY
jgi:alpha-galactosidase